MAKFAVRISQNGKPKLLGIITAKHQPDAVQKAWLKWPEHVRDEVQGGFSVVPFHTMISGGK